VLAAVLVVAGLAAWQDERFDALGSALVMTRLSAVLLALGAVFVLDDAAAVTVAAFPTPLWWRRMLRFGLAAVFVLPAWAAVLAYAYSQQPELPWPRLTLELTVLVTFGFAIGDAAARWLDVNEPGMTAALAVLGFTFIGLHLPMRIGLFAMPDSPDWEPSTLRWAGVLIVAVAVLLATIRDPGQRWRACRTAKQTT
jgi:hypothetical protein